MPATEEPGRRPAAAIRLEVSSRRATAPVATGKPKPRSAATLDCSAAIRITDEEGAGDHVDISLERDTLPRNTAVGPSSGSETSWRNAPQNRVTIQVLSAILLVCLGLLLGSTWTIQALQPKLRRQAEERRRLNEEWLAVRTARGQRGKCPRCGRLLTERDWYSAPAVAEDLTDDDD
jgi:hypothetical protein